MPRDFQRTHLVFADQLKTDPVHCHQHLQQAAAEKEITCAPKKCPPSISYKLPTKAKSFLSFSSCSNANFLIRMGDWRDQLIQKKKKNGCFPPDYLQFSQHIREETQEVWATKTNRKFPPQSKIAWPQVPEQVSASFPSSQEYNPIGYVII